MVSTANSYYTPTTFLLVFYIYFLLIWICRQLVRTATESPRATPKIVFTRTPGPFSYKFDCARLFRAGKILVQVGDQDLTTKMCECAGVVILSFVTPYHAVGIKVNTSERPASRACGPRVCVPVSLWSLCVLVCVCVFVTILSELPTVNG